MQPATALVLFPAVAAVLFSVAAIVLKRASQLGVDMWQTAFMANMMGAASYTLLWFLGGPPVQAELLWQPALIALCLFGGMACQFLALHRGDVSVAVPVMGIKVLIVAFLTPLLVGEAVRPRLWMSAVLSVIGVTLLNWRGGGTVHRSVKTAIVAGCAAAVCFGTFDILVQKWGPHWGAGRLLPCVFWINAVFSLGCIYGFRSPLRTISQTAWKWLVAGSLLVSTQSILFVGCLAVYGGATTANITYSARGLISVLLIWTIGHLFASSESLLSPRVLFFRLLGAASMLAAILLVVLAA